MLPYEILVGLRKTMCTCTCNFIGKQGSFKLMNIETRKLFSLPAGIPSSLSRVRVPYKNLNVNSTRRFHTQLLACSQSNIKDTKSVKLKSDDTSAGMHDSMNFSVETIMKKQPYEKIEDSVEQQNEAKKSIHNVPESVKKWLSSTIDKSPNKDVDKLFPQPKAYLHNLFTVVSNETNIPQVITNHTNRVDKGKKIYWQHTLTVKWPQDMSFTTLSHSKPAASSASALKCLYWLHLNNRIKNRLPVVYEKSETKSIMYAPEEFSVNENVLNKINNFLDNHENSIQEILSKTEFVTTDERRTEHTNHNPISHINVSIESRNQELKQRLSHRKSVTAPDLPIFQFRSQILNELENNQSVVIKGDTGCGKTTQVPQFIIDHLTEMDRGAECRMIVTQPRRISAISLAERIAYERNERVGDVVGYQVRLQQNLPKQNGAILFCTTGLLLKKLQSNLGLHGCSHIVIDEAHERSVDTDMLLVLIRRAMKQNPSLKVIVMSATINADLFQEYLGCNSVEVPGRLFPVKMNFLNDIEKLGIPEINRSRAERLIRNDEDEETPVINCSEITLLIQWICKHKPPGAILCFLPGWHHIQQIQSYLEDFRSQRLLVIPLHSKIPFANQNQIFKPAPDGTRKVILATDIAETGITVPDVVYVIDTACHKEAMWHESKGLSSIDTHWVTKANINQRKGRAGRVQEGESYHFISKQQYESLEPFPVPEVLRVSLEKTVLDCKTYSNEKAVDFLGSMPQPPRLSAVNTAVESLQRLGALDDNENLTALGRRIAVFSIHPKLSKAMVYASIFQCLGPVATIASALSMDNEIFYGSLNNKNRIRNSKSHYHPSSDHLAIAWMYAQWVDALNKGPQQAFTFSRRLGLHAERMNILHKVRDIHLGCLQDTGLIEDVFHASDLDYPINEFAALDELVRAVLLAGIDQILKHRNFEFKKGRFSKSGSSMVTEDNAKAQLTPESVNYKRSTWPSPYSIYYQKTHHNERRTTLIRESSMLSPVSVVLFSQGDISGTRHNDRNNNEGKVVLEITGKSNAKLLCDDETARTLLRFRDTIWSVVRYYIENKECTEYGPNEMKEYKKEMLNVLANLLTSSSELIDTSKADDNSDSEE